MTYLDTARGIGPIVEKLPHGLQEKWLTVGSRFKEENDIFLHSITLPISSVRKHVEGMTPALFFYVPAATD